MTITCVDKEIMFCECKYWNEIEYWLTNDVGLPDKTQISWDTHFYMIVLQWDIISYKLFEDVVRPDIHPKSSRSHSARGIWMTEGG